MSFSPREYRAIQAVATKNGYKLRLCAKPYVYLDYKGEPVKMKIKDVLGEYDNYLREERRNRKQPSSIRKKFML